jgi:hypothetical protein
MKNRVFLKVICIVLLFSNIAYSQILNRNVVASGGRPVENNGVRINCTIGQTHIALLKNSSADIYHGVGYWYVASYMINNPSPVCVVRIPELSAEIGNNDAVPLILDTTRYNEYLKSRFFEAKIRYNMTVLQPIAYLPECDVSNSDECTITVTGQMKESSGVMINIDFLVRLGSVESSPLIIESFKWVDNQDAYILKKDGELDVLGICREGDTIRTVKKSISAGLLASYPEPAGDQTLINYNLSENGYTKLSLSNNLGAEILTVLDGIAKAGNYSTLVDLTGISSGIYHINLITPTERFSRKLMIHK